MNIPKWATDTALIVVGSLCMAFSIIALMLPHHVVAGGPPGVAVLATQVMEISPGLVILLINAGLMLLGLRSLGMMFLLRTLAAVLLISVLTDGMLYLLPGFSLTSDRFLNAIYAGILLGTGIGLIFRGGGSSGGWSVLARLISDRAHIGIGQAAVIMDSTVVLISAAVFGDYETALLGGITVFICGQLIDKVATPRPEARLVHISSHHCRTLQESIESQFGVRGVLIATSETTPTDQGNMPELLYLSINHRSLKLLLALVQRQASDAHVTVTETNQVMPK